MLQKTPERSPKYHLWKCRMTCSQNTAYMSLSPSASINVLFNLFYLKTALIIIYMKYNILIPIYNLHKCTVLYHNGAIFSRRYSSLKWK